MAQRPLSFSNLKSGVTPQFFASYVEVVEVALNPRGGKNPMVFQTQDQTSAFWDDYYENCLREGEFVAAQPEEPWVLTLRVQFFDRRQSRDQRKWEEVDIVTPYLLELLDTTGLNILKPEAQAMLPADMVAYLNRDREQDEPSWFKEIQTALQASA
jgi:hypothetical protein